jgi:hypothetical protein
MRGGPYTAAERAALLPYCETDVEALARLLPVMQPHIDLPRALLRGRYTVAVARMESTGIPIDVEMYTRLCQHRTEIRGRLIATVDRDYHVFVPIGRPALNPASATGAAILLEAEAWGLDPYRLAEAVNHVWAEEQQAVAAQQAARSKARQVTGLARQRIFDQEHAGLDHSHQRDLEVQVSDLADAFPELGFGTGYNPDAPDETDRAAPLWETLRDQDERPRRKSDPVILRRAAEMLATCPDDGVDYFRPMSFSAKRWAEYLARKEISWPRLPSGALDLDKRVFKEMGGCYPEVEPIRQLRNTLSELRQNRLAVGADGRNRTSLFPFRSKTGRNQPSNSEFIFGLPAWMRSLIRPGPGRAVAYCDWSAQEFAIAAALSGDTSMMDAYQSGDPYLWLARRVGAVPPDATKQTHGTEREQFKVVSLGVLYGLGVNRLARQLKVPPCHGRELLQFHQETFWRFWQWAEQIEARGMLTGELRTVFGWTLHKGPKVTSRTCRNFPMQANGAEMMRIACCLATERGIKVCCPVHDAVLIESAVDEIPNVAERMQAAMREASEAVLPGFPLRTDVKIVRYPDRYIDERGRQMWETVMGLLGELDEAGRDLAEPGFATG